MLGDADEAVDFPSDGSAAPHVASSKVAAMARKHQTNQTDRFGRPRTARGGPNPTFETRLFVGLSGGSSFWRLPTKIGCPAMKSSTEQLKIAFIGLGKMGAAMAANVRRAGHPLVVWNRSSDKASPLLELGANSRQIPGGGRRRCRYRDFESGRRQLGARGCVGAGRHSCGHAAGRRSHRHQHHIADAVR